MKKRPIHQWLAIVLAAVMVISMIPGTSFANNDLDPDQQYVAETQSPETQPQNGSADQEKKTSAEAGDPGKEAGDAGQEKKSAEDETEPAGKTGESEETKPASAPGAGAVLGTQSETKAEQESAPETQPAPAADEKSDPETQPAQDADKDKETGENPETPSSEADNDVTVKETPDGGNTVTETSSDAGNENDTKEDDPEKKDGGALQESSEESLEGATQPAETEGTPENVTDPSENDTTAEDTTAAESTEETETQAEEEKYPAATVSKTVDGVTITLKAPEGSLPEGFQMKAVKVSAQKYFDAVEKELESDGKVLVDAVAFDIDLYDKDGNHIQPIIPVTVTFKNASIETGEGGDISVYRVSDSASSVTEMSVETASSNTQTFSAEHFTIYVAGGSADDPNGDQSDGANSANNR